jgi:membrane protease YdiL (CAAX protease family)
VGLAAFGISLLAEFGFLGFLGFRGQFAGLVLILCQELALAGVVLVWVRAEYGNVGSLGLARGWRGRDVGAGVVTGFGGAVATGIVVLVTIAVVEALTGRQTGVSTPLQPFHGSSRFTISFIAVVVAPFCEEVFFRGFVFQGLRRRFAFWPSALLSAGLFAFVHVEPIRFFGLMTMGVILAALFERRRSLVAPIAAHATVNLLATLAWLAHL